MKKMLVLALVLGMGSLGFGDAGRITGVSPSTGRFGEIVTVIGDGYGTETETISIDFGTNPTITTATGNSNGTFSITFRCDSQSYGSKAITVRGSVSGQIQVTTAFIIYPRIILVAPGFEKVGYPLTVQGVGYGTQSTIRIDFGTHQTITTTMSSENGTFSITFLISTQTYSSKTITARDLNGIDETIAFTIRASLYRVYPSSGKVGTKISLWGSGWVGPDHHVMPYFAGEFLDTAPNNSDGAFSYLPCKKGGSDYTINNQSVGTKIITARDMTAPGYPGEESATFYVIPNIDSIVPTSGPVGSDITLKGSGFETQGATVRIDFGDTETITTATVDSNFKFSTTFIIDPQVKGTKVIVARQGDALATSTFYVTSNISKLLPLFGPVGRIVTIEGVGFATQTYVSISFGTHQTITTTTSSANGTFGAVFITDDQPQGAKTITAMDTSGNYGVVTFFLKPTPVLSFSPSYQKIGHGGKGTVSLTISDAYRFFGAEAYISFNPAIFNVSTITIGSFISNGWLTSSFDNISGTINVGFGLNIGYDPPSGSGTLAQISFSLVGVGTQNLEYSLTSPRDTVVMDMEGAINFNRGTATIEVPSLAYIKILPEKATVTVTDSQLFLAQGYTAQGIPIPGLIVDWTLHQNIGIISASQGTQTTFTAGRTPGIGSVSCLVYGIGTYADISVIYSTATVVGKVAIDISTGLIGKQGVLVKLTEEKTGISTLTTTNIDSIFSFIKLIPGTYTVYIDTTGAGPSTKTGVLVTTDKATDIGTITLIGGDGDNDGRVRIFDFYILYFALKNGVYNPEADFDQDGDNDAFDFRVIYNNFFRGKKKIADFGRTSDSSIVLKSSSNKIEVGEEFTITLKIDKMVSIIGIESYLSYDPAILELISVEETLLDWQAESREPGEVGIVSGVSLGGMPVSGSSKEVIITFVAKKEGKTKITVKEGSAVDQDGRTILFSSEALEIEVTETKPSTSALFQSFPNPANNGCWIPFQLAVNMEQLAVEIYNIVGQKVKTIEAGPKKAGFYTNAKEGSAIFWDNTNEQGEKVSAGLYFYRLNAGKFTDTKAMVVK